MSNKLEIHEVQAFIPHKMPFAAVSVSQTDNALKEWVTKGGVPGGKKSYQLAQMPDFLKNSSYWDTGL